MPAPTSRVLLSGNEAIARGAAEAGCRVAAAYPGTPSSEILDHLADYEHVYCEWSTNEKVALEVAIGASLAGARALYASKHVGLNVAADPLFSAAYMGVRGGLVVISADDPGLHSSQNEQDNRFYGLFAKVPVLAPSDSQETKDFVRAAFALSEQFDIPFIIRTTTRINHSRTLVTLGEFESHPVTGFVRDIAKTVLLPANAIRRHADLEARLVRLQAYSEQTPFNRREDGDPALGIICDGVAYQYVKEAFPDAAVLKLGMVHPLPGEMVRAFAASVRELYVVEDGDPFLELLVRSLGVAVKGKGFLPRVDELSPRVVREAIHGTTAPVTAADVIRRPPLFCAGCPHAGIFYNLHKLKVLVTGDIGCYTLGALPPYEAMDTCVCMGAALTLAHGVEKAQGTAPGQRVAAVIGDSTFFHSGITGLVNIVYNQGHSVVIIVDNRTTAMTGHQPHPGTGRTLAGTETVAIDIEALCRGCGVTKVHKVDPYRVKETEATLRTVFDEGGPAVVITTRPCPLAHKTVGKPYRVDPELCNGCKLCLAVGCPAISYADKKSQIDRTLCIGCSMCAQVCTREAIRQEE